MVWWIVVVEAEAVAVWVLVVVAVVVMQPQTEEISAGDKVRRREGVTAVLRRSRSRLALLLVLALVVLETEADCAFEGFLGTVSAVAVCADAVIVVEALALLLALPVTVVTEVTVFLPEPAIVVDAVILDVLVDARGLALSQKSTYRLGSCTQERVAEWHGRWLVHGIDE